MSELALEIMPIWLLASILGYIVGEWIHRGTRR